MSDEIPLSENMENYLEVIFELQAAERVARSKDIAERMGVQRGSVTGALRALKDKGLVHYEPYSFITLTRKGKEIAAEIIRRHTVLKDFLLNVLQVDAVTADETACRMEHAIDAKTMDRLVAFIEYVHTCPRTGEDWLKAFSRFYKKGGPDPETCELCMQDLSSGQ